MIAGQRLLLTPLDRTHLAATRNWMNDPELSRLLGRARPVGEEEHQRWFEELQGRQDCAFFAIETRAERQHIGNIWLWNIDPRHRKAEVRIVLGEFGLLSKGLGTEALVLLSDYAFGQLQLHKLYAYVLGFNPRARRAFEKAGFAVEGTLKSDRWTGSAYIDVFLLGKINPTAERR